MLQYTPSFNKVCYTLRLQVRGDMSLCARVLGGSFIVYPFIVDHYFLSFYCRPLLFIILLSTIIVHHFTVDHYFLSFYCRPLLFILFVVDHYCLSFYCRSQKKLHSSFIFISGGQVVASANFDFTLLYKLIRNLLKADPAQNIPAPTCGWGNQPSPGHLNETDDIERIQHVRNFIAHSTDLEIRDANFSKHWSDLSQVK